MKRLEFILSLTLASSAIACGPELSRSSEVTTLRVLGVQKDKSYPAPGEQLEYRLLWHDAKERDLQPVWFVLDGALLGQGQLGSSPLYPLCNNPPGDSYYVCLELMDQLLGQSADLLPALQAVPLYRQNTIQLTVPSSLWGGVLPDTQICDETATPPDLPDELELPTELGALDQCVPMTHPSADPAQPDFGTVFVWFALCAGELRYDDTVKEGFPVVCEGEDGEPLGADDYVLGYTQTFVYRPDSGLTNFNPVLEPSFTIDEQEATACVDAQCLAPDLELPTDCDDGVICLDVCQKDDEDQCPTVPIKPSIPESYFRGFQAGEEAPVYCEQDDGEYRCPNAEPDVLAQVSYGTSQEEQMWIRYYVDRGRVASEVRLLNDANAGWNEDYGTDLRLPQEEGPITVWAVAYDNRGGQSWSRVHAYVK